MADSKYKDKDRNKVGTKCKRGRPVSKTMPPRIPDTPENVARAVLAKSPDEKKQTHQ